MKKLLLVLSIILGVTFAGAVLAAEPAACDLSQEYKVFTSATQNSSGSPEDAQKELSARASLLSAAIDCAREDVINLKNLVLPNEIDSAKQAKERVVASLDEAIYFYDIKKDSLKDRNVQGTKDLAKEIKTWRDNNYDQLSGRVQNFIIWSSSQSLFDRASDRLTQSQLAITSLKIIGGEDAQKLLTEARNSWVQAYDLNRRAGDAISRGLSPDETLGFIKQSLSSLALTYRSFLSISGKLITSPAPEEGTSTSAGSE